MNNKMIILCRLVIILMVLSGCGPKRQTFNQREYILEALRTHPRQEVSKNVILDVARFNINTAFRKKNLVYRKSQSEYETDFYNKFLISPDEMITEKTRSWFTDSGLFKLVLGSTGHIDATHVLEGNIIALYGDFRERLSPVATVKIRFLLVKLPENSVVFTKTYESTSKAQAQTAEALVQAYDKCLTNILTDLEKDLQKKL